MDKAIAKFVSEGAFITINVEEEHAKETEKDFKRYDKNQDGLISHFEFPKEKKSPTNYVELDKANKVEGAKPDKVEL